MIVNEILQWLVLLAICAGMLGLYRQWGNVIGGSYGTATATSGPRLHRPLPAKALAAARPFMDGGETTLAFVTEDCSGCQGLLARLEALDEAERGSLKRAVVVVALQATPQFAEALADLPVPVVFDDGEIWGECNIQMTPFLVTVDERDRVLAKEVTHEIDRVARGLDLTTATPETAAQGAPQRS
jgi:hypothetical protein